MASIEARKALFRTREGEDGSVVTNIELFFDLVFVFAVTQLSHRLLAHLTPMGGAETLVLFLAVWWVWIFTSWATNWLDPERGPVRAMLIAMMLGGLILSSAIPNAFERAGLLFAASYVVMQMTRTLAIVWAAQGHHRERARNFLRIAFYFALSTPLWIGGGLSDGAPRTALWIAALGIEYAGPLLFFRTPLLGRSRAEDWDISGKHMAERCSLFIIIALGEAIIVSATTYATLRPHAETVVAFIAAIFGSAAMWWIYFDTGAKRGGEAIEETDDTGRLARNAYTYLHMPIVGGIIVTAVADEMMLVHPNDAIGVAGALVTFGGPLLFLIGNQAFKWQTAGRKYPPLSHFSGELLAVGLGLAAWANDWSLLTGGLLATGTLIATAAWEWLALNGGWRRWAPWIASTRAVAPERTGG